MSRICGHQSLVQVAVCSIAHCLALTFAWLISIHGQA